MIILHGARPAFGLPSPSVFVTKVEILLKMAGLPYKLVDANFNKAPKGKIPFIETPDGLLGDSTFIRRYLEEKMGARFDQGVSPTDKAIGHAFAIMCDERIYWGTVQARWLDPANFEKGPKKFFKKVPAPVRPFVVAMIARKVKRDLYGQGLGRHEQADSDYLINRDIDSLATFLGDKPWLLGNEPTTADASVWPAVAGILCSRFETPIRTHAERHANLLAYRDRGFDRWFPDIRRD